MLLGLHSFTSCTKRNIFANLIAACASRQEPTMERVNTLRNAYDFIVTFLESMVESTVDVQKENQTVLRRDRPTERNTEKRNFVEVAISELPVACTM